MTALCACVCVSMTCMCVCVLCRLAVSDVKCWLRRFSFMDRDRDGLITADDLLRYLAVPSDACTRALFSSLAEVSAAFAVFS